MEGKPGAGRREAESGVAGAIETRGTKPEPRDTETEPRAPEARSRDTETESRAPEARRITSKPRSPARAHAITLRRYLSLFAISAKMDLFWLLFDWRLSLMVILTDIFINIASVTHVFVLAWRFGGVGGMSLWEVLFMLGYVTCVTGVYQLFCAGNNTGHISRVIGRGQVDHMMIQPLPVFAQLAAGGFSPFSGSQNLITGIGIIVWASREMGLRVGALFIAGIAAYLFVSLAIIIGLSYMFSSLAFRWQVAFEEVSTLIIDDLTGMLGNFPLSGMPLPIQWALVTVIPAGLLGWFPACALLGKTPLGLSALYPLLVAIIIWTLAAAFFKLGWRYYVRNGSNRYFDGGFRR